MSSRENFCKAFLEAALIRILAQNSDNCARVSISASRAPPNALLDTGVTSFGLNTAGRFLCSRKSVIVNHELKEVLHPVGAILNLSIWVCLTSDWVDKEDCIFVENRNFIIALVHHVWWGTHQRAVI